MAPTDKGKSLPKSYGPRACIYAQKLSTLKKIFSPSHFGFPCQRTEKGASDRTVKRVVRPSRKRAFYHAILASFMHNFFFVFFRTKKGGKGAS